MTMYKIFIACPISKYLTEDGMNLNFETFIQEVYEVCKTYTSNVFMALYREDYGKARMEDHICTPLDFEEMQESDLVIAFPEDSMGVAVELGWASALKKKVVLILNEKDKSSPLIRALNTVTDVEKIHTSLQNGYYSEKEYIIGRIKEYLQKNLIEQLEIL